MDKWQGIQAFWSSFGLPAYDENTVPQNAQLPYITYSAATGALDDVLLLSASIWYQDPSWTAISQKASEIEEAITRMGPLSLTTNSGGTSSGHGYLWIVKGSPFAQRMSDEDDSIRRIYINCSAEFLTAW